MRKRSVLTDGVPNGNGTRRRRAPTSEQLAGDVAVGAHIERLMISAGLSQSALARAAGLARPVLVRILHGTRRANAHHLFAVANAMGLTPADLLPSALGEALSEEVHAGPEAISRYIAAHSEDLGPRQLRLLEALRERLHPGARLSLSDVARILRAVLDEYSKTP